MGEFWVRLSFEKVSCCITEEMPVLLTFKQTLSDRFSLHYSLFNLLLKSHCNTLLVHFININDCC